MSLNNIGENKKQLFSKDFSHILLNHNSLNTKNRKFSIINNMKVTKNYKNKKRNFYYPFKNDLQKSIEGRIE